MEEEPLRAEAQSIYSADDKVSNGGSGIGVAFSGGGIRSAAFSSGVLRRILQKKVQVAYLSCVSGGGYTGSAYVEWKYRNGGLDNPQWHEKFFNHMRRNTSSQCNWRNPIQGLFDSIFVLVMLIFVVFLIPALIWMPLTFPLAYLVDYLLGPLMRSGFVCEGQAGFNTTLANQTVVRIVPNDQLICYALKDREAEAQAILYSSLLIGIILFYSLTKIVSSQAQYFFQISTGITTVLLAFTFLPWFFELYIASVPIWLTGVVLLLGVILWMGIPPLRSKASWTLLIYVYTYGIKYRVYKNPILGINYDERIFLIITWAATGLLLLSPFLNIIQRGCIHTFYRCKLQKAFYTSQSAGFLGCGGITCADFLTATASFVKSEYDKIEEQDKQILTLRDLRHIQPLYVCNMLVDNWIYEDSSDPDVAFTVLTISPELIERIDDDDYKDFDENMIGPSDIKLSDAMATSGAVVSYHMGGYKNEAALSLQMMFGLTMGKSWLADKRLLKTNTCGVIVPYIIQIVLMAPLLLVPLVDLNWYLPSIAGYVLMGIFIGFMVLLILISMLPTGMSRTSKLEMFVRWCIVNIYQVRFLRETLMINNIGEVPPPILYLSDGGHVENLGVLALLKQRMRKIIIADGGMKSNNEEAGIDLLHSLEMARKKLRCSFSGVDGRDILEDLRDKFVEPTFDKYPRHYKFKVQYYEKNEKTGETKQVGEGDILLLIPRHPSEGVEADVENTWAEYEADTGVTLKTRKWGKGPVLSEREANRLTGAFCECCHWACCMKCCAPLFGRFPQHSTANQFFTPAMFTAYHREGYRATVESQLDDFLSS